MAIRVCKHCRNRAAKLKWQDLMRAGKWCGSHSWLVLPPESEPFANQGSKCDDFWGSNCESTKFWKIFEVLTRCPSVWWFSCDKQSTIFALQQPGCTFLWVSSRFYPWSIHYITLHYITGTNTTATPQTSRNGPSSVSKAVHQPSQPLAALLNHLANKHQLLSQGKRRKVTYQPMTRGQMVRYGADAYFVDLCRSHRNKFKFK